MSLPTYLLLAFVAWPGADVESTVKFTEDARAFSLPHAAPSLVARWQSEAPGCDLVLSDRKDVPRLVLNTGGPVGQVWSLAFSADGSRLYSAGADKCVQVWGVRAETRGLRRTAANRAVLVRNLRWEIARGLRGVVYSMAASPNAREIAMGGYSARTREWGDAGDVVVYDAARGQVARVLEGHGQTVISLAYSPDGKRIASMSSDGEVRLWTAPDWRGRVMRPKVGDRPMNPQPLEFLSNRVLAVASSVDERRLDWRVQLFDVDDLQRPTTLPRQHAVRITDLTRGPDGLWASSDVKGNVFIWRGVDSPTPRVLREGRVAWNMSFAPDGRLFVATMMQDEQAVLEMWDVESGKMLDQVETAVSDHNRGCVVSPDGSRVATIGRGNEVWIFLLKDRAGNVVERPLSGGRVLRLRGRGNKVWKVAFSDDDSYRIGYGVEADDQQSFNNYGDLTGAFDTQEARGVIDVADARWRGPEDGAGGWTVTPQNSNRVLKLQSGARTATITLDPVTQGQARSYCWIPGDGQPFGIAVGTRAQQGVFVYRLVDRGECPLLRYYRDHSGWVTSLCVSRDGKYLVSGSVDQTIKVWSLLGLQSNPDFAKAPAWGATFALENGRCVLKSSLGESATTRKGLRVGDVVVEAKFARTVTQVLGKPGDEYRTADPAEIFAGLEANPPTEPLLLTVQRTGKALNRKFLLYPAWEPLVTLFIDRGGEWAVWSPKGYYNASVEGNELFGWLMNRGVSATPDFYRADQFQATLERPAVIQRLLATGSLSQTLRQFGGAPSEPNLVLSNTISKTPVVTILNPYDGQQLQDQKVPVVAKVRYPTEDSAATSNVRAFVNGVPGQDPVVEGVGAERTYRWNADSADFYNKLRVAVESDAPIQVAHHADVHFQAEVEKLRQPTLHLLAIAAKDYPGGMLGRLAFPIDDAQSVLESLKQRSTDLYQLGTVTTLFDDKVNPTAVQDAINLLGRELADARPDDLLVVFVAGHGFAFDNEYYFVPPHPRLRQRPESEEDMKKLLRDVGVSWRQLRQMSKFRCRKVFLLDTCYSGNVLLNEQPGSHWKQSIRPLKRDQIVVISATDVGQAAAEAEALQHGVFTKCLLDGFAGGADTSNNQVVDLREISDYVTLEVPRFLKQANLDQTPKATPRELLELISVPMTQVGGN